jgi:hypothetical protein
MLPFNDNKFNLLMSMGWYKLVADATKMGPGILNADTSARVVIIPRMR